MNSILMPRYVQALSLCALFATISISTAKPLDLVSNPEPIFAPTEVPSSPAARPNNQSINDFGLIQNFSTPPPRVTCSRKIGPALIRDQCREAFVNSDFARLPPGQTLTFEPRSSPSHYPRIGLPRRYLSSDGVCIIEPYVRDHALSARNTVFRINKAYNEIIDTCDSYGGGGKAEFFGGDNNLVLQVYKFVHRPEVQCYGSVDRQVMVSSCDNLANEMNASSSIIPVESIRPTSGDYIYVPHSENDPAGGGCMLTVSLEPNPARPTSVFSSWFGLWNAVVAINAMCIRRGQRGRVPVVAISGILKVDVGNAPFERQGALTAAAATA